MSKNTSLAGGSIPPTLSILPGILLATALVFPMPCLPSPFPSGQKAPSADTLPAHQAAGVLADEFTGSSPNREEMISFLDSLQTRTVLNWFIGDYSRASRNDTLQYELGKRFFEVTGDSAFLDLARAGRLRLRTVDLHTREPENGTYIKPSLFKPLQKVITTYVKHGLIRQEVITNLLIAEFEQASGGVDYPKYLSLLFESLTLARENGYSTWEAHVLLGIARLFNAISRFDIAREYFEKAQNVAQETADPIAEYRASVGLARIELETGDPEEAFRRYSDLIGKAVVRLHRDDSYLYQFRGMARLKLKDPDGALEDFLVARAWARTKGWLGAMQNASIGIARVHEELGEFDEAGKMYLELIEQDESPCRNPTMWFASYRLGLLAQARGDSAAAVEYFIHSVECIERSRKNLELTELKMSFFEDKMAPYEKLVELLYDIRGDGSGETGIAEKMALEYCERSRMRSFLDISEGISQGRGDQEGDEEYVREHEILTEIGRLRLMLLAENLSEGERGRILGDIDDLQLELMETKISRAAATGDFAGEAYVDPNLLDNVRENILDEKTCIIEYFIGRESSHAWLITKNGLEMKRLPGLRSGYGPVTIFIDLLFQGSEEYPAAIGKRLYRNLVAPFEDRLDGIESLILITDDVLNYLPFECLPAGGHGDERPGDRFLVEDYSISYAPSLSTLDHLSSAHPAQVPDDGTLLAIGDPIGGEKTGVIDRLVELLTGGGADHEDMSPIELVAARFPRLKKSADEVRRIASFFPQGNSVLFLRNDANESALKAEPLRRFQVIHFATHGVYDNSSPEFSGLLLSPSPGEDGFLVVDEIMHMSLNCSLVVLSGCRTGLGQLVKGEGIVGLSRAFLVAGASAALVSLWEIGDSQAADFMEEFYRLYRGGMDKSEALTQAKRNMIRRGTKYAVWAPFVLIGDPK